MIHSLLFKSEQRHIEYNISDLSTPLRARGAIMEKEQE